ncbi:MAG: cysteine desulfurase family protein [Ignavibacteriaceae bacterium]|nr:cysteine desulfurase family protein [Ignavibacteriaceae bacterium]
MKFPVYMDNNSTTQVDEEVFNAMKPWFLEKYGNASSKDHSFGWEADAAIEYSRKLIGSLINAEGSEIIFTSGATESINLAHWGIAETYSHRGKKIITSAIEHNAVIESLKALTRKGFEVIVLDVNNEGFIDIDELKRHLDENTLLVSIMTANNEIGIINDVKVIGDICAEKNILFHTDATQAIGKIPFDVKVLNTDLVSFSGHKFYAPKGVGGLYINKSKKIQLSPRSYGGGQEHGIRSGTLNVPGIVGIGKAAEICKVKMESESAKIEELRNKLFKGINEKLEDVKINGSMKRRLPNNLSLCFRYVKAENIIMEMRDIAISTGAACTSASLKPNHVLKAIGLTDEEVKSSIRIGLGRFNTEEEIEYAINRIVETIHKLRSYSPEYIINHKILLN